MYLLWVAINDLFDLNRNLGVGLICEMGKIYLDLSHRIVIVRQTANCTLKENHILDTYLFQPVTINSQAMLASNLTVLNAANNKTTRQASPDQTSAVPNTPRTAPRKATAKRYPELIADALRFEPCM